MNLEKVLNSSVRDFLHAEQVLNNHRIYPEDYAREYFRTTLPFDWQPAGRKWFRLPYFLVPESSPWALQASREEAADFLEEALIEVRGGGRCYRFFVHPLTQAKFLEWVGEGLAYVGEEESLFWATPTSSYRSLLVVPPEGNEPFMAKVSLFTNLTNGSRHIDWHSALGQWEHSRIMEACKSEQDPVEQLPDVAALGLDLQKEVELPEDLMITIGPRKVSRFGTVIRRLPIRILSGEKRMVSIASLTSPERFGGPLMVEMAMKSGISYGEFILESIIRPLLDTLHRWILGEGFLVEPHCQNTLVELDGKGELTGRFYYRDFDRMHLDRDVFPLQHPDLWSSYIQGRPDRTTAEEEAEARLGTLQVYFHHFLKNLCWPLLRAGYVYRKLTEEELELQYVDMVRKVKSRLFQVFPEADPDFLLDIPKGEYGAETLGKRHPVSGCLNCFETHVVG